MQNKNLGSEKLTELERVRRIISVRKKQLSLLMIELASLRERERELMPLARALEQSSAEGRRDGLEPAEFAVSRVYEQGSRS